MFNALRRAVRFGMRHGFKLVGAFLVVGYGLSLLGPKPVTADARDPEVAALKKVALSDVALSERLIALNKLKAMGGSQAEDALADVAESKSLSAAAAACAQLGRAHTSSSKSALKYLLEKGSLSKQVRMAAASAIAEHWHDEGDLSYLEEKCEGDNALSAHCAEIASRVYGQ